ncbi:MAG TPA: uroporphyrinogen decarboxylase family protein [Pontiellaceae bacterium]|nr:uroporphyrinogen decarboxylase family protein [Pontiellaceae bacterium]HPR82298.1 uroporphyrinogen decarboxylase family protein [Pontiellaceae bacterium]
MQKQFYLDLADRGLRLPIGTHLILHEKANHDTIIHHGDQLGAVMIEAAQYYKSPLAIPLMDLTLEKEAILAILGVPAEEREKFHFDKLPAADAVEKISTAPFMIPRMEATCEAVRYVAEREQQENIVALGMGIGPFSLMTKMLSDPITPVFMAGTGMTAEDDDDVALVECVMELSTQIILRYLTEQAKAGAKAIILCEPAANLVFFSPNQLAEGSDVFERFVMQPNLKIKAKLDELGVDLIFHDCGELTDGMVESFNRLNPVMLSLGCSRTLWKDAALLSKDIVLYGNLPSKKFYSDEAVSVADVERMTRELITNMKTAGHPFIMGTECDVLSVPGHEESIKRKVDAMMSCSV